MAKVIIKSKIVCDMCGQDKSKFVRGSFSAVMGVIQSQSDRWDKLISFNVRASIPYHSAEDICTDCVKEAFNKAIDKIDER